MKTIGEVTFAAFGWSPFVDDGRWCLYLLDAEGEPSPLMVNWDGIDNMPGLDARSEALTALGYAAVSGGEDAWEWRYLTSEETGDTYRVATARVRPLAAADLAALPD